LQAHLLPLILSQYRSLAENRNKSSIVDCRLTIVDWSFLFLIPTAQKTMLYSLAGRFDEHPMEHGARVVVVMSPTIWS
jgi:hypothetical protein